MCLGSLRAITPENRVSSQKLIVIIFNYSNTPKSLIQEPENGSLLVIAGLVYLCLEATPGYISSRSFRLPSTSSNYRISFEHSFPHCSLFTFSLSYSRRVPWPWLRFPPPRNSQSLLSPSLRISTTPQLGFYIPPSLTFAPLSLSLSEDLGP